MQNLKCLIVGDGASGKSCLLIQYTTNAFPSEYVPTVFDNYSANVTVDGTMVNLGLWDTAGQEDYDRLRPLSYPGTDVALVAFSVASGDTFANVAEKWVPELRHFIPDVPIVLVGCKSDLRDDPAAVRRAAAEGRPMVTQAAAEATVRRLGLAGYVETSALHGTNTTQCFAHAIRAALASSIQRKKAKSRFFSGWRAGKNGTKVYIDEESGMSRPMPQAPVMPETGRAPWVNPENATLSRDFGALLLKSTSHAAAPTPTPTPTERAPRYGAEQPAVKPWFSDLDLQLSGTEIANAHKAVLAACSPTLERFVRAVDAGKDDPQHVPFALLPGDATRPQVTATRMDVQTLKLLSADQPPAYVAAAPPAYDAGAGAGAGAGTTVELGNDDASNQRLATRKGDVLIMKDIFMPPPVPPAAAAAATRAWPVLTPRAVRVVVEWLYTGEATRLPGATTRQQQRRFVGTADQEAWLDETVAAAGAFECEELKQYVANIRSGDGWLNPSFTTYLSDRTGNSANALLCGRDWLSDVAIQWAATPATSKGGAGAGAGAGAYGGVGVGAAAASAATSAHRSIPGHAAILCARCPLFAAQITAAGGRRADCTATVDEKGRQVVTLPWTADELPAPILLAILEFIYRDHVEFGEIDANGNESGAFTALDLLHHAFRFGLSRLVSLCELRITKVIDAQVTESIRKSKCDVIGILNTAAAAKATQLEAWCLFFISSNRWSVAQMASWKDLSPKHRRHVDSHQWPPPSYVKAAAKYETELKQWQGDAAKLKKLQQKSGKKQRGGSRSDRRASVVAGVHGADGADAKGCSIM